MTKLPSAAVGAATVKAGAPGSVYDLVGGGAGASAMADPNPTDNARTARPYFIRLPSLVLAPIIVEQTPTAFRCVCIHAPQRKLGGPILRPQRQVAAPPDRRRQ